MIEEAPVGSNGQAGVVRKNLSHKSCDWQSCPYLADWSATANLTAFGFARRFSTGRQQRWTTQWQAAIPRKEDQLGSEEIVMRKIKEVLRLKFEVGLGLRRIATLA